MKTMILYKSKVMLSNKLNNNIKEKKMFILQQGTKNYKTPNLSHNTFNKLEANISAAVQWAMF